MRSWAAIDVAPISTSQTQSRADGVRQRRKANGAVARRPKSVKLA